MRRIALAKRKPHVFVSLLLLFAAVVLLVQLSAVSNLTQAESITKTAQSLSQKCKRDDTFLQQCYQDGFSLLTKDHDIFFAEDVLKKLWSIDAKTRSCHAIAHAIALSQIKKEPSSFEKVLSEIDPQACSGGLFHGILEGHYGYDPSFNLDGKEVTTICESRVGDYEKNSCSHIMGHILLLNERGNVPAAVKKCDGVDPKISEECYNGIFMENMARENLKLHGIEDQFPWNRDTSLQMETLCFSYSGKAASGCWGQMGHMYSVIYNDSPKDVFAACNKAPDATSSASCYAHAVEKIVVTADNTDKVNQLCVPYLSDQKQYGTCMSRAVDALLTSSEDFFGRAYDFCQASRESAACFNYLNHLASQKLSKSHIQEVCKNTPKGLSALCKT